jgi:hypothetical protein
MSISFKALGAILLISLALSFAQQVHAFGLGRLGIGFGKLGAITQKGGSSPPPGGCQGAVDASAGCPLPMIGV